MLKPEELEEYADLLVDNSIATDDEIELVSKILGWNEDALNKILYVRAGLHDLEQLKHEIGIADEEAEENEEDFACGGKKKEFNKNREELFEESSWKELSEEEISKILTPEEKEEVDSANCDCTNRVTSGTEWDGFSEWASDTKLGNGWTVRAYYYQPEEAFYREDGEQIEDLGELDWVIDHYMITD